jgi:hypothetical protein
MAPECRYWGDKNPHYVADENQGCLEAILELFPAARFIHIIRDGRDVVCSRLRRGKNDFEGAHRMWTSHVNRGCAFGRQLPPGKYFELRYEDLVCDDLAMATRIFTFLGVEMHPNVVNWCQRQREQRTPLCKPTRDIVADVTSSDWATFMTTEQQMRSLELLGRELVALGYESEASFRNAFQQAASQYASALLRPVDKEPRHTVPNAAQKPLQREIQRATPAKATVLVVSKGDERLLSLGGRTAWHFPQSEDGLYAGYYPGDSVEAIAHLEALRARGAEFIVFPQSASWWLDHYAGFREHLQSRYSVVARRAGTCLIFDLRAPNAGSECSAGAVSTGREFSPKQSLV